MADTIYVRAGDTEPLEIIIGADGLTTLDDLDTAVLYVRAAGASTNHVDGDALSVLVSADRSLTFDPVAAAVGGGNAFVDAGTYLAYVLATWSDGDTTRHPGASEITIHVRPNYE